MKKKRYRNIDELCVRCVSKPCQYDLKPCSKVEYYLKGHGIKKRDWIRNFKELPFSYIYPDGHDVEPMVHIRQDE